MCPTQTCSLRRAGTLIVKFIIEWLVPISRDALVLQVLPSLALQV